MLIYINNLKVSLQRVKSFVRKLGANGRKNLYQVVGNMAQIVTMKAHHPTLLRLGVAHQTVSKTPLNSTF